MIVAEYWQQGAISKRNSPSLQELWWRRKVLGDLTDNIDHYSSLRWHITDPILQVCFTIYTYERAFKRSLHVPFAIFVKR